MTGESVCESMLVSVLGGAGTAARRRRAQAAFPEMPTMGEYSTAADDSKSSHDVDTATRFKRQCTRRALGLTTLHVLVHVATRF